MSMKNKDNDLIVPRQAEMRSDIKAKAEAFYQQYKIIPPFSYQELSEYVDQLLEKYELDKKYHAFTMVCCGNTIWRNIVGTIPYNRRLLLLPKCLAKTDHCPAHYDELGLLCADCGSCSISKILKEAEDLGYAALVTEGTTVTTKLIENKKVNAIIGVGCMESLKEIFATVNNYAIPGIGIPLLSNGCKNTEVDEMWVREEMIHFKENANVRLLDVTSLKNKIDSMFTKEHFLDVLGPVKTATEEIARNYIISGGKRLRPFFAVLTYEAYCKKPDTDIANRLAILVDYFHKASLIHDDIEDSDSLRDGKATIHARYGIPVALNLGDLMIGEGYKMIANCKLSPDEIRNCLSIISEGHVSLSNGQGAELMSCHTKKILSVNDMLEVYKNKTGAAFKVSMLLGAIVGGADEKALGTLGNISDLVGIAYQLKDDLDDYIENKTDITNRKFSFLLSLLTENISTEEKKEVYSNIESGNIEIVIRYIDQQEIQEKTEALIKQYVKTIRKSVSTIGNLGLKLALYEIFGKVFKKYL